MRWLKETIVAAAALLTAVEIVGDARADEPVTNAAHYVLTRSFAVDESPSVVLAAASADDEHGTPLQGCDGQTYYLSADDAEIVQGALTAGSTVQLHSGDGPPLDAAIVCLFQAQQ